jgi:hypothetical protein
MGTSPILCDNGGAVSAHTDRSPSPFPFFGVGWGASELAFRPAVATGTTGSDQPPVLIVEDA